MNNEIQLGQFPVREVPVGVLFFSTTDRRGVIDSVNQTFIELSKYSRSELIGAPHNIIRHPGMPAGAFRVMWERLLSGRPMVAYVHNVSRDGHEYRTLATVTALGDRFLSVRCPVSRPDLWDSVMGLYAKVRSQELALRSAGASRHEVGLHGARALLSGLFEMGFLDYDDVIATLLPAELDARRASISIVLPEVPPGHYLHQLVAALHTLVAASDSVLPVAEAAHSLASTLRTAARQSRAVALSLGQASQAALSAALENQDAVRTLVTSARAVQVIAHKLEGELEDISGLLQAACDSADQVNVAISLASLHADAMAGFVSEAAEGSLGSQEHASIADLCLAIELSSADVAAQQAKALAALRELVARLERAKVTLLEFQKTLADFRMITMRVNIDAQAHAGLVSIDSALRQGLRHVEALSAVQLETREVTQSLSAEHLHRAALGVKQALDVQGPESY